MKKRILLSALMLVLVLGLAFSAYAVDIPDPVAASTTAGDVGYIDHIAETLTIPAGADFRVLTYAVQTVGSPNVYKAPKIGSWITAYGAVTTVADPDPDTVDISLALKGIILLKTGKTDKDAKLAMVAIQWRDADGVEGDPVIIPPRPAAPVNRKFNVSLEGETAIGARPEKLTVNAKDVASPTKIVGLTTTMQYKTDYSVWTDSAGTSVETRSANKFYFRFAAIESVGGATPVAGQFASISTKAISLKGLAKEPSVIYDGTKDEITIPKGVIYSTFADFSEYVWVAADKVTITRGAAASGFNATDKTLASDATLYIASGSASSTTPATAVGSVTSWIVAKAFPSVGSAPVETTDFSVAAKKIKNLNADLAIEYFIGTSAPTATSAWKKVTPGKEAAMSGLPSGETIATLYVRFAGTKDNKGVAGIAPSAQASVAGITKDGKPAVPSYTITASTEIVVGATFEASPSTFSTAPGSITVTAGGASSGFGATITCTVTSGTTALTAGTDFTVARVGSSGDDLLKATITFTSEGQAKLTGNVVIVFLTGVNG